MQSRQDDGCLINNRSSENVRRGKIGNLVQIHSQQYLLIATFPILPLLVFPYYIWKHNLHTCGDLNEAVDVEYDSKR